MTNVLIGGIGNVLLGDDGVGPYVIRLLESTYAFDDGVEIADLGTPALDLTHRIAGRDAVILVDCVASSDRPHGSVELFRKDEILRTMPAQRLDPHSPALAECLMTAEMLGASPRHLLLVGVVGRLFEPGQPLSDPVSQAIYEAIHAIVEELTRLGVRHVRRSAPIEPDIWWTPQEESLLTI